MFKKERESFEEFEKLDELLLDDIEEGPGLGCTSPEVNKSVHNHTKTIACAPSEQTTLVNLKFVLKRLSLQLWTFFENVYFLYKSFVKVELSYVFTLNLFIMSEKYMEKWIIL